QDDPNRQEARDVRQERRPLTEECLAHVLAGLRDMDLEHEQRDGDCEDTIRKGLEPGARYDVVGLLGRFHGATIRRCRVTNRPPCTQGCEVSARPSSAGAGWI